MRDVGPLPMQSVSGSPPTHPGISPDTLTEQQRLLAILSRVLPHVALAEDLVV